MGDVPFDPQKYDSITTYSSDRSRVIANIRRAKDCQDWEWARLLVDLAAIQDADNASGMGVEE